MSAECRVEDEATYRFGEVARHMVDEIVRNFALGVQLFRDLVLGADKGDTCVISVTRPCLSDRDSPYTVVMTVCLTTLRNTFPLAATAKTFPSAASLSTIKLTKSAICVYTSAGLSPPSRLTARAPWVSPPSAA